MELDARPVIIPPLLFQEFVSGFTIEKRENVSFGRWSGKQVTFRFDRYKIPIDKESEKAFSAHLLYANDGKLSLFAVSRSVPENEGEFFGSAEIIIETAEKDSGEKDPRLGEKIERTILVTTLNTLNLRDDFTRSILQTLSSLQSMTKSFDFGSYWTKAPKKKPG